jgi:holliday junction DNA helicase RuvA
MISYISGIAIYKDQKYIVLQTNSGVGYKIYTTQETLLAVKEDEPTSLWIHSVIREDAFDLYGFRDRETLSFFELLLNVSGIGPKSALNILSSASVKILTDAITSGETGYITKISGIGKKVADKIVLELKGKVFTGDDTSFISGSSSDIETVEALKALGYNHKEAKDAIEDMPQNIKDVSEKIKFALKNLSKK